MSINAKAGLQFTLTSRGGSAPPLQSTQKHHTHTHTLPILLGPPTKHFPGSQPPREVSCRRGRGEEGQDTTTLISLDFIGGAARGAVCLTVEGVSVRLRHQKSQTQPLSPYRAKRLKKHKPGTGKATGRQGCNPDPPTHQPTEGAKKPKITKPKNTPRKSCPPDHKADLLSPASLPSKKKK